MNKKARSIKLSLRKGWCNIRIAGIFTLVRPPIKHPGSPLSGIGQGDSELGVAIADVQP